MLGRPLSLPPWNPRTPEPVGVLAVGTAVSGPPVSTAQLLEALRGRMSPGLQDQVLNLGTETRHSIVRDLPAYLAGRAPRELRGSATSLAAEAIEACLNAAGGAAREIGLLIAVTNTADRPLPCLAYELLAGLGPRLSRGIDVLNLQNQGCSTILKAAEAARWFLAAHPGRQALVVAAEAHTGLLPPFEDRMHAGFGESGSQAGPAGTQRMVSAFLFGDGAVALLLGQEGRAAPARIGTVSHLTNLVPEDQELLSMDEGGMRNPAYAGFPLYRMGSRVPQRGIAYALRCTEALALGTQGPDPAFYCVHTGSRKILDGVQRALRKSGRAGEFGVSYDVLARYGNLSSCSTGFMLSEHLRRGTRGVGLALSFGVGFSASAGIVEFRR